MTLCIKNLFLNLLMLIQVDLTLPDPEHPKGLPLEAKRLCFGGGFAGGFVGCVTSTVDRVTG